MLQAIPDPFDSYGPPQAEDSIFSILPPLSIISNAPSRSQTPSQTPEANVQPLPASGSSWLPTNGFFPDTPSDWTNVHSSSSTPPRSSSPPPATYRRQHPPGRRRRGSESTIRTLSAANEGYGRGSGDANQEQLNDNQFPAVSNVNGNSSSDTNSSWDSFTYGQSPYEPVQKPEDVMPRHSTMYSSQSTERPPDPGIDHSRSRQSDEDQRVPVSV
jgi:hypothetical protein